MFVASISHLGLIITHVGTPRARRRSRPAPPTAWSSTTSRRPAVARPDAAVARLQLLRGRYRPRRPGGARPASARPPLVISRHANARTRRAWAPGGGARAATRTPRSSCSPASARRRPPSIACTWGPPTSCLNRSRSASSQARVSRVLEKRPLVLQNRFYQQHLEHQVHGTGAPDSGSLPPGRADAGPRARGQRCLHPGPLDPREPVCRRDRPRSASWRRARQHPARRRAARHRQDRHPRSRATQAGLR